MFFRFTHRLAKGVVISSLPIIIYSELDHALAVGLTFASAVVVIHLIAWWIEEWI